MNASSTAPRARDPEEEEDVALPPLDADEDEEEEERGRAEVDEELDDLDDGGDDPLDDANASDLVMEDEIDEDETTGDSEPAEDGIDVGALEDEIDDPDGGGDDTETGGMGDDDDDLDALEDDDDDGGAEGTSEPVEDDIDEELPALDADEDGDFEGEDLLAETLAMSDVEVALPPWDAARWGAREGAGAEVPCTAVAVRRGRVACAADRLLLVGEDGEAARRASIEAPHAVAMTDGAMLVATARDGLFVCDEDGDGATELPGFRARRGTIALAATPDRAWALQAGAIWCVADPSRAAPTIVHEGGGEAIAASGGALVALVREGERASIEKRRSDDEGWQVTDLEGDALRATLGVSTAIAVAAQGKAIAIAGDDTVCVSRDGGRAFTTLALSGALAVAFEGDDVDASLLVLIGSESDDAAYLARVPSAGDATLVAEIVGAADEGGSFGACAMAWDASREVVWVACRAGLVALGRPARH